MKSECLQHIEKLRLKGLTLDVGSLDINGNPRRFCEEYIGLDMRFGKNVNIVALSQNLPFKDNTFDNVISIGTLNMMINSG